MSDFLVGAAGAIALMLAYWLGFRDGRDQERALNNLKALDRLVLSRRAGKTVRDDRRTA